MDFILKILTYYVESIVSFSGKKITIRKTIYTKLKKTYFININSENLEISPEKLVTNVTL